MDAKLFPDIRERLEKRKYLNNVYWEDDIARLLKAVDLAVDTINQISCYCAPRIDLACIKHKALAQLKELSEGK